MATSENKVNGSEFASFRTEIVCSVCKLEGETRAPVGFCKTCKDHLCKKCFKGHKVLQTRGHVLEDKSKTPKDNTGLDDKTCHLHASKAILYHCSEHSLFGCSECYSDHGGTCQVMTYIPEISNNVGNSRKFKDIRKTMTNIATRSKSASDGLRRRTDTIDRYSRDAKADLDSFKLDLVQVIEEHIDQLKETVYTIENNEKAKLENLIEKYDAVQSKAEKTVNKLDSLKNKNDTTELYIAIEKGLCEIPALQYELSSGQKDQCTKSYKYEPNYDTLDKVQTPLSLGQIQTSNIIKVEHIGTIKARLQDDKEPPVLTGTVLMPKSMLVVADHNNNSVKMFNTENQKYVSDLQLPSKPWTLAKITESLFAVSLYEEKKVIFIRIGHALKIERELVVDGKCKGLAFGNGLLVVSFMEPYKVELMDLDGRIVRILENDNKGQKLFKAPDYLAMNTTDNVIYVSNYSYSNVLCMNLEGGVLSTYSDIRYPRQVVINATGQVLISEESPPTVRKIEQGCKVSDPFLSGEHGLTSIGHISYNESEEKLFVAELNKTYIKVFRLIYS